MMEKKKLRRADFVFSMILLAFGLFILGYGEAEYQLKAS